MRVLVSKIFNQSLEFECTKLERRRALSTVVPRRILFDDAVSRRGALAALAVSVGSVWDTVITGVGPT